MLPFLHCAVGDQQAANAIAELSNDDYRLFTQYARLERVKKRLEKTEAFVAYLEREEQRELDVFKASEPPDVSSRIRRAFEEERVRVWKSAHKNLAI